MRQSTQYRLGQTILRQAGALARQPFEIAVLAEMDDRVDVKGAPDPEVKGEIVVRRHQIRVVIAALGIDVVAARQLHADKHVAKAMQPETKRAIDDMGIALGAAPSPVHRAPNIFRQRCKGRAIVRQRPGHAIGARGATVERVGRPLLQQLHHDLHRDRRFRGIVPGTAQGDEDVDQALRRIQSDAVSQPAVAIGVIG